MVLALAPSALAQSRYMLETDPSEISRLSSQYSLTVVRSIQNSLHTVYVVTAPTAIPSADLIARVSKDKAVVEIESDSELHQSESKSNPASFTISTADVKALALDTSHQSYFGADVRSIYANQLGAQMIELPSAFGKFPTGKGIIAIIDTGVDPNHPALRNSLVPGYDFTRNIAGYASEMADLDQSTVAILDQSTVAILDKTSVPALLNQSTVAILDQSTVAILDAAKLPSDFGHGTMVAGLVHLTAPTAQIMPLKAFKADGTSSLSDIIRAVYYATDHGAKAINMSFSLTTPSTEFANAIAYAASKGVLLFASAGNDGKRLLVYPAGLPKVVGVGSTDKNDRRSRFSNYGTSSARTSAPGEALITTYPGGHYAAAWGTSFSTALVTGASALFTNVNSRCGYSSTMDALGRGKRIDQDMGDARLDLLPSLTYLQSSYRD